MIQWIAMVIIALFILSVFITRITNPQIIITPKLSCTGCLVMIIVLTAAAGMLYGLLNL